MTNFNLIEGCVDAVRNYFIDNFDDEVADVETEVGDGITLDPIFNIEGQPIWHVSEIPLNSLQQFPVGFILGGDSNVGFWNNTNVDAGHEITISVIISDQNASNLRRKLYRYQRAIWETLVAGYYADELDSYKILGSPFFSVSPTVTRASLYLGEARVVVQMRKQETRS